MFDHVTIRVSDRGASERFYDTVLATLGVRQTHRTGTFTEWHDFGLAAADIGHPTTRRLHVAFVAASRELVDAFWRAGEPTPGVRNRRGRRASTRSRRQHRRARKPPPAGARGVGLAT